MGKIFFFFKVYFVLFWGRFSFISFNFLRNTINGFLTQFLYLSNDNVFSTNFYVFTHLCLFEWKTSSKCFLRIHMNGITLHIKLKWDNELCNKWSSISSNLVIIWMVLEIYLHFVIYHYDYNFFTTILFNNLILISKVEFFYNLFFGFWTTLLQVWLQKNLLILTW